MSNRKAPAKEREAKQNSEAIESGPRKQKKEEWWGRGDNQGSVALEKERGGGNFRGGGRAGRKRETKESNSVGGCGGEATAKEGGSREQGSEGLEREV